MRIIKIEVENYKSIIAPVSVNFQNRMPTVLIGKNGSGKSNILEAVEHIASANANLPGKYNAGGIRYKAHICMEKDEFVKLFPCEDYSEEKATFVAFSSTKDTLHIDTIKSEYIVPLLKKELVDVRSIADELNTAIEDYEKTLQKIDCDDLEALSLCGFELVDGKGNTTNYGALKSRASFFIDQVKRMVEVYADGIKSDNSFIFSNYHYGIGTLYPPHAELIPFKLRYKKPELAPFEQKFIAINETAIKREITKINKKTEDACQKIDKLIGKLKTQSERLLDTDTCGAIEEFLRKVCHIFGDNCGYLLNESNQVLFKDLRRENDNRYYDPSRVIFEAYAKANNKPKLLENKEHKLSDTEAREFEEWLNSNRPTFDEGMFMSIMVSLGENNEIVIKLEENNGQIVSLNETSAGRRWYFTYYFAKCTLTEGDTFIIDEPASMLHPSAQKEILKDLIDLSKKGIRVIYSTHSSYMIPDNLSCIGFVCMEKGTTVSHIDTKLERSSCLKSVVGDVFDLESVVAKFQKNPQKIAENCYQAIKEKDNSFETAAKALKVSPDTIKSWHRRGDHFRSPKLENVISVATYADISIEELLK